ncbi:MAG: 23S rRNA (guanosine(2251)-2'-O)-methyltransferase RlmB [Saprospiraceae bacterium]|nr:23S rRNA (guanosine(2251)-2'-O)-methyltransferase RlmB [Saprospiraceae bacterium]
MKKANSEWLIGKNALHEALAAGKELQKVYLGEYLESDTLRELIKQIRKHKIPVLTVPKAKLDKLCNAQHQGVLALINPIFFQKVHDVVIHLFESGENPALAILDGITDVHNFGAIARSAEILGIHALIIGKKQSAPINHEAIKSSAGALLRISVCRENNLVHVVKELKKMGIQIYAASEKAKLHVNKVKLNQPLAFILGSEGEGIDPLLLAEANELVKIPQIGHTNSLNVSVASGILFYERMTQNLIDPS